MFHLSHKDQTNLYLDLIEVNFQGFSKGMVFQPIHGSNQANKCLYPNIDFHFVIDIQCYLNTLQFYLIDRFDALQAIELNNIAKSLVELSTSLIIKNNENGFYYKSQTTNALFKNSFERLKAYLIGLNSLVA